MNESEKKCATEEATQIPASASGEANACDTARIEEEAAMTQEENKECTETESPAMSVSEAADELTAEESEGFKKYHDMTKAELLVALKEIVSEKKVEANREVGAIKGAFFNLRNSEREAEMLAFIEAGNAPEAFASQPDETENEVKEMLSRFKEMRAAYLEAEEEKRNANLARKIRIIDSLRAIVADIDNINLRFPEFQQLQQDFKGVGEVPAGADNETWKSYQEVVEQFYDHLKMNKELRDLDFKKNLEAKRQLIERAKELTEVADPIAAFRKLQGLHDEWRLIGPVAKELREAIWDEFKAASTIVNKRYQEFFLERKAREKENEDAKIKLCEEAESVDIDTLKSFSAWDDAVKQILDIQGRWKEIGFASRKVNNELYSRYRAACDKFFGAKNEFYKKAKEEFASNLAKKTALCEKAEALLQREDRGKAAAEMQALQQEWRTIGSPGRKHSDAIWKRFSTAANTFFEQRKKENAERHSEESANLAKKRDIIARLKEIPLDSDRKSTIGTVQQLQKEWRETGFVPFKSKKAIQDEYKKVCDAIYEAYDIQENRRRISRYESRLDNMKGGTEAERERRRLENNIKMMTSEMQTYENNLGFFNVKTSAGSSMVKELERKIKKIKEDIAETNQKLRLLEKKEREQASASASAEETVKA